VDHVKSCSYNCSNFMLVFWTFDCIFYVFLVILLFIFMVNKIWTFFFYNLIKIAAADQWLKENVHLKKKKNFLSPPMLAPSPGTKGGGLCFRHVKVYWVYLKLKIPWQCLFMHFIFLLRNYILIHKAGFT
jgi:hypothetical protein